MIVMSCLLTAISTTKLDPYEAASDYVGSNSLTRPLDVVDVLGRELY